jgi:hypothetical protein
MLGQKEKKDKDDVDSMGVVPTLDDDCREPEDTCAELQVSEPDRDESLGEKRIEEQGTGFTSDSAKDFCTASGVACSELEICKPLCQEARPGASVQELRHDGDTIINQQMEGSIRVESGQRRPREEQVKSFINGAAIDGCTTSSDTCRRLGTDENHEASSGQMQDEDNAYHMSPRKRSKCNLEAEAQRGMASSITLNELVALWKQDIVASEKQQKEKEIEFANITQEWIEKEQELRKQLQAWEEKEQQWKQKEACLMKIVEDLMARQGTCLVRAATSMLQHVGYKGQAEMRDLLQKLGAWAGEGPTSKHNLFNAIEGDAYQYRPLHMDEVELQNWQMTASGKGLCTDEHITKASTEQKDVRAWELKAPVQGDGLLTSMRRVEESNPQASESADDIPGIGDRLRMHPCCAEQSQANDNVKPVSSDHSGEQQEEEVPIRSGVEDPENESRAHSMEQRGNLQGEGNQEESAQRAGNESEITISPTPTKDNIHAIGSKETCMLPEVKAGAQDDGQRESSQCTPPDPFSSSALVRSSESIGLANHAVQLVAHEQQALLSEDLRIENIANSVDVLESSNADECGDKQLANASVGQKDSSARESMTPVQGNLILPRTGQEEESNPQASESADDTADIGNHLQIHPCCAEQSQANDNVKPVSSDRSAEHKEEEVRIGSGVEESENESRANSIEGNGDLQFGGDQEDNWQRGGNDDNKPGIEVAIEGRVGQDVDPGVGDIMISDHAGETAIIDTAVALVTLSSLTSTQVGASTTRNLDNLQSHESQIPEPQSLSMAVTTAGHDAETHSDGFDQQIDCDATSGPSTAICREVECSGAAGQQVQRSQSVVGSGKESAANSHVPATETPKSRCTQASQRDEVRRSGPPQVTGASSNSPCVVPHMQREPNPSSQENCAHVLLTKPFRRLVKKCQTEGKSPTSSAEVEHHDPEKEPAAIARASCGRKASPSEGGQNFRERRPTQASTSRAQNFRERPPTQASTSRGQNFTKRPPTKASTSRGSCCAHYGRDDHLATWKVRSSQDRRRIVVALHCSIAAN